MKKTTYTIYKVECAVYWDTPMNVCVPDGPDGITEKDAMHRADVAGWLVINGIWSCPHHVHAWKEREVKDNARLSTTPIQSFCTKCNEPITAENKATGIMRYVSLCSRCAGELRPDAGKHNGELSTTNNARPLTTDNEPLSNTEDTFGLPAVAIEQLRSRAAKQGCYNEKIAAALARLLSQTGMAKDLDLLRPLARLVGINLPAIKEPDVKR